MGKKTGESLISMRSTTTTILFMFYDSAQLFWILLNFMRRRNSKSWTLPFM